MGVVLKRAIYFITCSGRMYYPVRLEEDAIVRNLLAGEKQDARMEVPKYHQMSLFDDTMPFADLPNMRWPILCRGRITGVQNRELFTGHF